MHSSNASTDRSRSATASSVVTLPDRHVTDDDSVLMEEDLWGEKRHGLFDGQWVEEVEVVEHDMGRCVEHLTEIVTAFYTFPDCNQTITVVQSAVDTPHLTTPHKEDGHDNLPIPSIIWRYFKRALHTKPSARVLSKCIGIAVTLFLARKLIFRYRNNFTPLTLH